MVSDAAPGAATRAPHHGLGQPCAAPEALVDPSIRWRLQIFRLPFALVFTGVGLAAGWMLWRLLSGRDAKAPEDSPPNPLTNSHWGLWAFTPSGAVFLSPWRRCSLSDALRTLVGQGVFGCFCGHWRGHGLGCCSSNPQGLALPWSGRDGTAVTAQGWAAVEVTLVLPPRAAQHPAADQFQLRVAQYRVDEASSGSPERRVQTLETGTRRLALAMGICAWWPGFPFQTMPHPWCPAQWRACGLAVGGCWGRGLGWLMTPVQASTAIGAQLDVDPHAPSAAWQEEIPIDDWRGKRAARWLRRAHPGCLSMFQVREGAGGWSLQFGQTPWRWSAVVAAAALVGDGWNHARLQPGAFVLPQSLWGMLAWLVAGVAGVAAARCNPALDFERAGRWSAGGKRLVALVATGSVARCCQPVPGLQTVFTHGAGAAKRDYYAVHAKMHRVS